ncbi:MAG: fibronectin type III domain-containing protein, partial [Flavobacterium sp.]
MKKITLLILTLFLSLAGFSQFSEGFEGSTLPNVATSTWQLGSGTWGVFDNGVGTTKSWNVNSGVTTPPTVHGGTRAAYMDRENIGVTNTSRDYLATPQITIPTNGELKFWTRTLANGNQGTIFKIMVSTTSQTTPAAYTLVQQWTEDELTATYNIYEEKSVNLAAYAGQNVYIAFVMEFTQPTAALGGDRWLVDDMRIVEKCLDPTALTATAITQNSATLGWSNPGNATNFEIQVLPFSGTLGASGTAVTGTSFVATGTTTPAAPFTPTTQYKFYVRAICTGNVASGWVGPFSFSTSSPGLDCGSPIVIPTALPYTTTDNTVAYGDTTDVQQAGNCAGVTDNYMTGNDVFYSYTPTTTGAIQIEMTPGAGYSGIFVYEGCANVGINCVAGVANPQSTPRIIPSLQVTAGTTYIIVLSSNATPQTFPYTLTIQALNCASPNALSAVGTGPTSANLSWGNPGGATSWEVVVQTAGSPIPAGPGVTTSTNTNYGVTALTGSGTPLVLGTPYQYWVRANCGDGTFSIWSGPYVFNTTICASGCNYIFTMADTFGDGWNGNTLNVVQSGNIIATLTGPTNADGTAQVQQSVPMCDGPFELVWNPGGSFGNEVSVSITNSFGQVIYTKPANTGSAGTTLYTGVVDCSAAACLPPLALLAATNVTTNTAILSWTPNGAPPLSWDIFVVAQGSPAPTATTTPTANTATSPYTVLNLNADTTYVYYVRAVCAGSGQNPWSGASAPFTTLPTCPKPTALVVSNVTQTTATFAWTAGLAETAWEYIIVPSGSPAPSATDAGWVVATNPLNVTTGLIQGSNYSFYVRAVCSPTDKSSAAGPLNFSTLQTPAVLPFEDGFEGTSSWTTSNGTQVNQWFLGSAISNTGTKSMYVSNDNAVTNTYTTNTTSVTHFYRDLAVPAGSNELNVQFDWRAFGESSWDYIRVWAVPTTFVPVPGTQIAAAAGRIQLGANINQNPAFSTSNYVLNAATFAGQTMRLVFEWRNDSSGGTQPPGAIDNVVVNVITCSAPSALTLNSVGQTTADLSWTAPAGGAGSYDYYVATTTAAPTATTTPTGNVVPANAILADLATSTQYYVWVRSNCGPDGTSTWVGPLSIVTSQVPGVLPFTDGFEGTNTWSISNGTQTNKWFFGSAVSNTGTKSMYVTNNEGVTNAYTISAASVTHFYRDLIVPAGTNEVNVQFDWRAEGESSWDYIRVWAVPTTFVPTPGTQIAAGAGRIQLGANINQNSTWSTSNYVLNAAGFAGQTMRIIFEWRNDTSGGTQPPGAIDNVVINVITCSAPSNILLNAVGQTTADLSWTAPAGGAGSYDYFVSTTNTTPAITATPTGNVIPTNLQLIDLTPSTTYYVWVRSNCGPDGTSTWTGPISVTTGQIPAVLPFIEGFEGTTGWSFNSDALTNKWIIGSAVSNGGTKSLYITNNNGTTNTYTVNSTTTAHAYRDIQMPAVIGEVNVEFDWRAIGEGTGNFPYDYLSVWAVPTTFVPVVGTQITTAANRKQIGRYNNNGQWQHVQQLVDASAYSGQSMRIVFEWRNDSSGGAQPPAAIDNVKVNALVCPAPINLTASGSTGSTAITLTWTPVGTETTWEVIVQVAGSGPPVAGTGTIVTGTPSLPFNATSGVFYEFYVIANCSTTESSFWAGPQPFSIYTPPGCAEVQLEGVGVDIVNSEIILCAEDDAECVNLSASYFGIGSTTSYAVSSIDYDPPFPFTGGIEMPITSDDDYTPSFTLPFNFCFFGESYDFVRVGDNGVITFGLPYTDTYGDYCPWTLSQPIPNTDFSIKNAIYGVFQDMYTTNNPGPNTSINYQVLGTYPCRALVVNFNEVPAFGSSCTGAEFRTTTQIVLYEISNVIEIYVKNRTACTGWQSGLGVLGIQNAAGTIAYTPPGRNTGAWNASNEAWRFEPNGESNVEFQWLKDGVFYANTLDIEVCVTDTTVMTAQATYQGCDGVDIVTSSQVTIVTTTEIPTNNPVDLISCSSTGPLVFDLTQNTATILANTVDPTEFTVTYYLTQEDADAEINAIANPEAFEGVNGQTIYVAINSAANCFIVKSFQLIESDTTPAVVEFTYTTPVCYDATTPSQMPIKAEGFSAGGTFTATGITIDPATGAIDLSTNPEGTFEVTYTLLPSACNQGGTFSAPITLNTAPVLSGFANVNLCGGDSYTLPALTIGNYFTATQGGGTALLAGDTVSTTQTIYVYAVSGTCFAEQSFEVVVTPTPVIAPIADVVSCGPYTLPSLAVGNYFTAADGAGTQIPAGTVIATDQTIYVYATTGTTPDCTASTSFTVSIVEAIVLSPIANVTICSTDTYLLPTLSQGNYYTQTMGGGTQLAAGTAISSTQTIYVFASGSTPACNSEVSFTVTVTQSPMFIIQGNCVGNQYILTSAAVDSNLTDAIYAWTTTSGTIIGSADGASVTVEGEADYTLTVTVAGCSTSQVFTADNTSCMIQKGISPNGDG